MRPKARLLLLVVIPLLVVGCIVTVGRVVLGDSQDASNAVALSEPQPARTDAGTPTPAPEPTSTKKPKKKSSEASPTKTARGGAHKSEPTGSSKKTTGSRSGSDTATSTSFASQVVKLTNSERTKA